MPIPLKQRYLTRNWRLFPALTHSRKHAHPRTGHRKRTLLITGASGGVGSAAIQLAKARGARAIAVAGKKSKSVLDAGADQALVRAISLEAALGENAVDVVIDLVGGEEWPELLNVLRPLAVMPSLAPLQDLLLRSTSERSI